jgi:hypothetical protein
MIHSLEQIEDRKMSIAKGAPLTEDTWADFVTRLRHDCVGAGVEEHYTADAIFIVQAKRYIFGIDTDFGGDIAVLYDECYWFSPEDYYKDLDEEGKEDLDTKSQEEYDCPFLELNGGFQGDLLSELPEHTVTGVREEWEYVNAHFTKDAAEAFIARKKHDYPDGLRVYIDAQVYCWEYNTIKEAILSGKLQLVAK